MEQSPEFPAEIAFSERDVASDVIGSEDSRQYWAMNDAQLKGVPKQLASYVAGINRYQALVEFDLEGTVIDANDNFLKLFGYSREDVIGQHHRKFCRPGDAAQPPYARFWEELRHGEYHEGDFCRVAGDGREIYIHGAYNIVRDQAGQPIRVLKHVRDTTKAYLKSLEDDAKVAAIGRAQAVIEFDMGGNILSANPNFLQLMGYKEEELVGQHHRMFVERAEGTSAAYKAFWKKLAEGTYHAGEYLRIGKDARRVWIHATYNPILDPDGRPYKVVKFASDITAQKLVGLETQARLDAVSMGNGVLEVDRDRRIALGYDRSELIGKAEAEIMFEDDLHAAAYEEQWTLLRDGKPIAAELRRKGAGRREVWLVASAAPVLGLDGNMKKVVYIAQDITTAKLSRLDTEAKISAIDRSQAVIEFGLDGRVLTANANFLGLMGYSIEEIRGHHHRMFVDPEEVAKPDYQDFWERLGDGDFNAGEFKRIGKGGREVWIQATYTPVFDPLGRVVKVVKFATDVTALKLQNAEFEAKVTAIDSGLAVVEFDLDGRVLTANRNFLAAMGYTLREIQGQHHSMFCTEAYTRGAEYRDFWLRLNEGDFFSGRFHRIGKFDREVWIQATYSPIRDLNGKVAKVVKYAYDVTKEVELEGRIRAKSGEMSGMVKTLVESIAGIAENCCLASQVATESVAAAQGGQEAVRRSIQAIGQIQESAVRVSDIVRIISDIAGQTNLLAFNAAIEAARAGTQGAGFSVVAAEVRRLAERTSQAASEISRLIEQSSEHVKAGAGVSQSAATSFEGILTSVQQTVKSTNEIADQTTRQREVAKKVTALIDDLASTVGQ